MIRTKQPQIINAQLGTSEIVYFACYQSSFNRVLNTRNFKISTLIKKTQNINGVDEDYFVEIAAHDALYKESTFQSLFGAISITEFEQSIDQLMIDQISWVNNYQWTGNEVMPPIKYWSLTQEDLEIVPNS